MGISQQQALDCFASDDLIGIGMEADSVRRGLHPDGIVTYAVDCTINFDHDEGVFIERVVQAVADGVPTVRITVPSDKSPSLSDVEIVLGRLRERFPYLYLQALTAVGVSEIAAAADLSAEEVLLRLRNAGLDAIDCAAPGLRPESWLALHRAAHLAGIRSTASLTFGGDLRSDEFVSHLFALRTLQEETAGFTALSLQGFRPQTERAEFEQPTAVEYLRTLAIARMVLDNFDQIESSCVDEGLKVMQMALRFGANDGGTIGASGSSNFTESDLRRVIRDAGFAPVERDSLYRTMFLNN